MKKWLLYISAGLLGLLLLVSFFLYTRLENFADSYAERLLNTSVEFERLDFAPTDLRISLSRVQVFHPDRKEEKVAVIERISLMPEETGLDFFRHRRVKMVMDHPKFLVITKRDGEWELAGRVPLILRGEGQLRLTPLDVESVVVKNGEVEFRDGRVSQPPTVTRLTDVQFRMTALRKGDEQDPLPTKFSATFKLNQVGKGKIEGNGDFLSPKFSFRSDVSFRGISLPHYRAYFNRGQPVQVLGGSARFASEATCEKEVLKAPGKVWIRNLDFKLKKRRHLKFAANMALDSLKNDRGEVVLDVSIQGNIRRPRFIVLTDVEAAALEGIKDKFKGVGRSIKEGTKSGFRKLKGVFTK